MDSKRTWEENGWAMPGLPQVRGRYFKKDAAPAPAPDPLIGQSAAANAQLSKDWMEYAKERDVVGDERQKVTDALTGRVVESQLATQDQATKWATEDRDRNKTVFQPLQDDFIATAKAYDTPEKQAAAAATARGDVMSAASSQRDSSQRNMASLGISPLSGRFAAVNNAGDVATSLAAAGAENGARQMVKDKGLALRADAINMGNGLASSAGQAAGISLSAGSQAVGNNQSGNNNFTQQGQSMNQGYSGAVGANASAGGLATGLYSGQIGAYNAQNNANASNSSGLAGFAGLGLKALPLFL